MDSLSKDLQDQEQEARKLNEETKRADNSSFEPIELVETRGGEVERSQTNDPKHDKADEALRVQYSDTGFGDPDEQTSTDNSSGS